MPVQVKVTGGGPVKIKLPAAKFWKGEMVEIARVIRVDTEKGKDVNGKRFDAYTKKYEDYRARKGRNRRPNLSFTSRMMSQVGALIRATKGGAKMFLSGEQTRKAWYNLTNGREFFGISNKSRLRILKSVKAKIAKDNQLK